MPKKQMSDEELQTLVEGMRASSLGRRSDALSLARQDALDQYFGRPYGNEISGRSQVVDRTLMECVEWTMPQIMRAICTQDALAEFMPLGPDDVDQAQQETDYVNYVIMQKNDGFIQLHDAIKDALLLKNGYIKRSWEEYSCPKVENYTGLNEEALTMLMTELEEAHDAVEVLGKTERDETLDDGVNPPQPIKVYDIKLRVRDTRSRVFVRAAPAEEVMVSPRCRGDLQDTDFVGHEPPKTRSDLIEMGMPKDFVEELPAVSVRLTKPEDRARDPLDQNSAQTYAPNNTSEDQVDYLEGYVRVDWDGDGVSELRKVVLAGGKLPPGPKWNEEIEEVPLSYGVVTRMGHRQTGISLADFVEDIQLIRTTLVRQGMDNIYQSNNQRPIIGNKVELSDIALTAPGAPIRVDVDGPIEGYVEWAQPAAILPQLMPILDYWDDRKEQRTGIGKNNTIIDSDVLRDSANDTITTAFNAANARVEMYLRMLSETLIRDLVRGVHGLICRHQQEPETVQLRGKWVKVDPRSWKERTHVNITVGLGLGTAEEKRKDLMFIAGVQQGAAPYGLVSPTNGYNLATDIVSKVRLAGAGAKDRYFTDPASPEGKNMAQSKQQQAQAQQQMPLQIAQIKAQGSQQQQAAKAQHDQQQSLLDHQLATSQIGQQQYAESKKLLLQAQADAEKMQLDHSNNVNEIILNFVGQVVSAALKANAPAQSIPADIQAAESAAP